MISVVVVDLNTTTTASSTMAQPVYDTLVTIRNTTVPLDINLEADYVFNTYTELHGDPSGNYSWTALEYLYVGCTDSITLTYNLTLFVESLDVNCTDSEIGAYTFYAPTVDYRSSYCAQLSHTIVNLTLDGASSIDAVSFTSTCTPTLLDPSSCGSINLK